MVQIAHGIADFSERYGAFARYLNERGILVVAEDHMGHGRSIAGGSIQGHFHGGWFCGVADTYHLLTETRKEYPDLSYILFGHSMGSFMARTILCQYPDSGIAAAVICGTAWQPDLLMPGLVAFTTAMARAVGETNTRDWLQNMAFGSYNARIPHPRTAFDWTSRDPASVDFYVTHPHCGFTATTGLLRDMMIGIRYIQRPENLAAMRKDLPVFFLAGGEDPVGNYGRGVLTAAEKFRKAGMTNVTVRLYPQCRHEILQELNRREIFADVADWIEKQL